MIRVVFQLGTAPAALPQSVTIERFHTYHVGMDSGTVDMLTYVSIALQRSEDLNKALFATLVRPVVPRYVRDFIPAVLEENKKKRKPDESKKFRIGFCESHNIGYQQLHDAQQNYRKWVVRRGQDTEELPQDDKTAAATKAKGK